VEPTFEKLDGQDPLAYIASANLERRHLTKGQQAMARAFMYPEPEKAGRKKAGNDKETLPFSRMLLSQARFILRQVPEVAKSVLDGDVSFDEALEKATLAKQLQKGSEAKMVMLRQKAPDWLTGWVPPLLARLG
jgi:hypothetical protein